MYYVYKTDGVICFAFFSTSLESLSLFIIVVLLEILVPHFIRDHQIFIGGRVHRLLIGEDNMNYYKARYCPFNF